LEFGSVGFYRGKKTREPRGKPSEWSTERTNNKLNPQPNPGYRGRRRVLSLLHLPGLLPKVGAEFVDRSILVSEVNYPVYFMDERFSWLVEAA